MISMTLFGMETFSEFFFAISSDETITKFHLSPLKTAWYQLISTLLSSKKWLWLWTNRYMYNPWFHFFPNVYQDNDHKIFKYSINIYNRNRKLDTYLNILKINIYILSMFNIYVLVQYGSINNVNTSLHLWKI